MIEYRLPTTNQGYSVDPDTGDSTQVCELPGSPLTDLYRSYLYGVPSTGGVPLGRLIRVHNVFGRNGQIDTFRVDNSVGYNYWVVVEDFWNNFSCPSNTLYVGPVTSVPEAAPPDGTVVYTEIFDLQGRFLQRIKGDDLRQLRPLASGVYFLRAKYKSGKKLTKKFVVLK